MRYCKDSRQPSELGKCFSSAKKPEPDRIPAVDEVIGRYKGNHSAVLILNTAKKYGVGLDRFGRNYQEITDRLGVASFKFSRGDRGYCRPEYVIAGMIIAENDLDTSKWLIMEMASKVGEKEVRTHLENICEIMEEAKKLGLDVEKIGTRKETTADEMLRVATNRKYRYAKLALGIIVIGQKPEDMERIVLNKIMPECSGSELYGLEGYILDRKNHMRMSEEKADLFIERIRNLLKSRGLPA